MSQQKFSGKNFTVELSNGFRVNIYECEGTINSGLKPVTGGGWIAGEPEPPTITIKLEMDQMLELVDAAPDPGGIEEIDLFDMTFAGESGGSEASIEIFGVKLKAPSNLLSLIKQEAENMIIDIEGMITDRQNGYIKINGKYVVKLPGVTDNG